MKLESNSLKKDYFRFVAPTLLSLLVYTLYSTVDGIFVARGVNPLAVSAVNISLPFIHILFSIAIMIAVGTSTLCAIFLGQKNQKRANELLSQNLIVAIVLGLIVTAVLFIFMKPIAYLLGATDNTYEYVKSYLSGIGPFGIFFIISYSLEVLVKTDGYPLLATIAVTVGCLFNCIGDYIFIFIFDMGVFGAAFATGLSQFIVSCIYLAHFFTRRSTLRLTRFKFDFSIYRRLVPIGIPDSTNELCIGVMLFLYNRIILHFIGENAIVSYTIVSYINTIFINLMIGVSQGSQPLISYHYGKKEPDKCRKLLNYGMKTTIAVSLFMTVAAMLFAPLIIGFYLPKGELFEYSLVVFRKFILVFLVAGFNMLFSGYFTAVEYSKAAICISFSRAIVLQSICLVLLAFIFGGESVWFAPLVSEILTFAVTVFFIRAYKKCSDSTL